MTATKERMIASCSFCLKPDDEVKKLVAGPGVYICNECVELCGQIIGSSPDMPPGLTSWEESLDLDGVLRAFLVWRLRVRRSNAISRAMCGGRGSLVRHGQPSELH